MPALFPIEGCPRQHRLADLYASNADVLSALLGLAALHGGGTAVQRTREIDRATHPAPRDVDSLTLHLLQCVFGLLGECRGPADDLRVAAFLMEGIARVQPFARANNRIALDIGVFLLMQRWGLDAAPVAFESTADRVLDVVGTTRGAPMLDTAEGRFLHVTELSRFIGEMTLSGLKEDPIVHTLAEWLSLAMGLEVRLCA